MKREKKKRKSYTPTEREKPAGIAADGCERHRFKRKTSTYLFVKKRKKGVDLKRGRKERVQKGKKSIGSNQQKKKGKGKERDP